MVGGVRSLCILHTVTHTEKPLEYTFTGYLTRLVQCGERAESLRVERLLLPLIPVSGESGIPVNRVTVLLSHYEARLKPRCHSSRVAVSP